MNTHFDPNTNGVKGPELNVLGAPLANCAGYFGLAEDTTDKQGLICCSMTRPFMMFLKENFHDMMDEERPCTEIVDRHYCVPVTLWYSAYKNGTPPPIILEATPENILINISADVLIAIAESCRLYD